MSTLNEQLTELQTARDNIKTALEGKGQTVNKDIRTYAEVISGIETGDSGLKQFETIEAMHADTNKQPDDLALIYRNEQNNITATSVFREVTFPKTVVLPTALTDYVDVRLRAVDDNEYLECFGMLDSSMFDFQFYGNSGSVSISYSSADGITYTKSGKEKTVDFGTDVAPYPAYWNDAIGYFMQVKSDVFDGLYKCNTLNNKNIPYAKQVLQNGSAFASNMDKPVDLSALNVAEMTNFAIAFDSFIDNGDVYLPKDFRIYTANCTINLGINSTLNGLACIYASTINEYKNSFNIKKESYVDGVLTSTVTMTPSENTPPIVHTESDGERYLELLAGKYVYATDTSYLQFRDSADVTTFPIDGSYGGGAYNITWKYQPMYVYQLAPTQLTVNTSNELLPGKIAYGKNGLVTGDNSVYSNINVNEYVNHLTNNAKFKTIPCITSEGIASSKLYSIENAEISEFNHVIIKDTLKQSSEIASEILTKIGVDVSLYNDTPSHYPISKDESYYYFLIMLYDSVDGGGYKYWIFKASNLDYSDAVQIGEPFKANVIFSSAQIMTPVINNHIVLLDLGYYDEPQFVDINVANNTVTFQQIGTTIIRDCYDSTLIGDKYVLFSYGDVCNNYIYKFNTGELVASTGLFPTTFDDISYSNAILLNDIYYVVMCYVVSSTRYIKLLRCDSTGGLQLADITSESSTTAPNYVLTTVNDELYMFSSQLDSSATPTIIKINTTNPSSSTRLTGFAFNYTTGVTSCTVDKNTLQYKLNNSVIMYASGLCVIDFTAKVITFKDGANLEVRFNYDNISEGVYGGVIRNNYVGVPNGYVTIYLNKKLAPYTKPSSNGLAISLNSSSTNIDLLLLTDLT